MLSSDLARFHWVFDQRFVDVLALRTLKGPQIGMGWTRFDPGQHHSARTLRAAWPFDSK